MDLNTFPLFHHLLYLPAFYRENRFHNDSTTITCQSFSFARWSFNASQKNLNHKTDYLNIVHLHIKQVPQLFSTLTTFAVLMVCYGCHRVCSAALFYNQCLCPDGLLTFPTHQTQVHVPPLLQKPPLSPKIEVWTFQTMYSNAAY